MRPFVKRREIYGADAWPSAEPRTGYTYSLALLQGCFGVRSWSQRPSQLLIGPVLQLKPLESAP